MDNACSATHERIAALEIEVNNTNQRVEKQDDKLSNHEDRIVELEITNAQFTIILERLETVVGKLDSTISKFGWMLIAGIGIPILLTFITGGN